MGRRRAEPRSVAHTGAAPAVGDSLPAASGREPVPSVEPAASACAGTEPAVAFAVALLSTVRAVAGTVAPAAPRPGVDRQRGRSGWRPGHGGRESQGGSRFGRCRDAGA